MYALRRSRVLRMKCTGQAGAMPVSVVRLRQQLSDQDICMGRIKKANELTMYRGNYLFHTN
jgi:hypothetical protein